MLLVSVVALAALGTAAYFAAGGRVGLTLLMVKYVLRKEYAPTREVQWQAGPTEAQSTGSGARPPNVILIVADD
ncbi:MAG: sulfatase, partial [Betaproteobacteria bacterium]|nr:sulfatase [Betaproteobacteria bacterium]